MLKYQTEAQDPKTIRQHLCIIALPRKRSQLFHTPWLPISIVLVLFRGVGGGWEGGGRCGCLNKANELCVEEGTCKTIEAYTKNKNTEVNLCAEGRYKQERSTLLSQYYLWEQVHKGFLRDA